MYFLAESGWGYVADHWLGILANAVIVLPAIYVYFKKTKDFLLLKIYKELQSLSYAVKANGGVKNGKGSVQDLTGDLYKMNQDQMGQFDLLKQGQVDTRVKLDEVQTRIAIWLIRFINHEEAGDIYTSDLRKELDKVVAQAKERFKD